MYRVRVCTQKRIESRHLGSIVRHSEECYNSVVFDASTVLHRFMLYAWHRMKHEESSKNILTTLIVGQDRLRPPAVAACCASTLSVMLHLLWQGSTPDVWARPDQVRTQRKEVAS